MTRDEINAIIRRAVPSASRRAFAATIDKSLSKVAKRKGNLRKAIKADLLSQLAAQKNAKKVNLVLSKDRITARANHAQYHWVVGPRDNRIYENPTTPGTAPIQPTTLLNGYRREFKTQLILQLKKEGLNVI